ncbi:hypothetical protein MHPYR_310079 [uncultured Mycobacterium sp.]|uniref:Uncharacterized protein n=1 Tax=uncultured Mycobacterium sp. TaxID=171292 RepID=A0A1Y5PCJ3_9MYCO|nr:hypothetical protein MHPYR_310079 [uncultured Mycobacterium sp.]
MTANPRLAHTLLCATAYTTKTESNSRMKTIPSSRYRNVLANYEVLVEVNSTGHPVIALKADPMVGKPFLMPMEMRAARDMALMIIDTIVKVDPSVLGELMEPAK